MMLTEMQRRASDEVFEEIFSDIDDDVVDHFSKAHYPCRQANELQQLRFYQLLFLIAIDVEAADVTATVALVKYYIEHI